MEGRRLESVNVLLIESAYINNTLKNDTIVLWHTRLGHVSSPTPI